jgi:glucose/arabinose dehydrogenase
VRARKVATLDTPLALAVRPGESGAVYIAQKGGVVKRLQLLSGGGVTVGATPVIDLSDRVFNEPEQGLLGIAFSADGNTLYTYWTNTSGNNGVYAYPFAGGVADKDQQKVIISIEHPGHENHNGGNIIFGPDGFLYIGTGDGGGAGDPDHNAQDKGSLLGKMLRIAPNPAGGYTVPASNPFVATAGALPEIYHYGLRNPWRWSFDRSTHDLVIGDVGQGMWEEIDRVPSTKQGANFGWNRREGKHPYNGGTRPPGNVEPIYEYSHANGNCSITGGYVYRGSKIAGLQGAYLFADYCVGVIKKRVGTTVSNLGMTISSPSAFGQDAAGELWVLSLDGGVFRLVRKVT